MWSLGNKVTHYIAPPKFIAWHSSSLIGRLLYLDGNCQSSMGAAETVAFGFDLLWIWKTYVNYEEYQLNKLEFIQQKVKPKLDMKMKCFELYIIYSI